MQPKRKLTKTTYATFTKAALHIRRCYPRGGCCHAGVVCLHLEVLATCEDLGDVRGPSAEFTLTFHSSPLMEAQTDGQRQPCKQHFDIHKPFIKWTQQCSRGSD